MRRYAVKLLVCALCLTFVAVPLFAQNPPDPESTPAFDMMKSLEGTWAGSGPEGMAVKITYKVVSEGSAVMESIDHTNHADAMVSVYHLDKDRLMMTHYCSAGNQPRMRLTKSTPTSLAFTMFDITNLGSKDDLYMRKVSITWKDKNHIKEEWTAHVKGKDTSPHVFELERKQ
jgi:hypothetical protein